MKRSTWDWPGGRCRAARGGVMAACALACIVAGGPVVRGEDDRAVDEVLPGVAALQAQQQANLVDLGANFDDNVFRQQAGGFSLAHGRRSNAQPAAVRQADQAAEPSSLVALRKLGDDRLARIEAICGLSAEQRRKLRLAAESDIRRLADEIDVERQKYQGLEVNLGDQEGQQRWQQFQQDVQRCRSLLQSLFQSDALLMKVLPSVLDAEQYARLAAENAGRRACLWKAMVATAMLKFDDLMGLDQRQHEALERLLLERQPPLRIDVPNGPQNLHARQMLVFVALSEIDGERLQAGVSERQGRMLVQFANQGKAMRSFVEAQGLLEKVAP